ncbi:hypothetical protein ACWGLB_16445 [Streptomyces sp. NPDC055893]
MSVVLGDRFRFAAAVGEPGPLCRVDLWAAGKWLTCDDNMAYVPAFRRAVLDTCAWLRSGEGSPLPFPGLSAEATHRRLMARAMDDADPEVEPEAEPEADYEQRSRFQVLHWGPTTDNVIAHLFREKDDLVITLEFWREEHLRNHPEDSGVVYVVEIQAQEFVSILDGIVAALGPS